MSIKRVGIWPNLSKDGAFQYTVETIAFFLEKGVAVSLPLEVAHRIRGHLDLGRSHEEFVEEVDVVIIFGGDGTFLDAALRLVPYSIPLLGVNLGQLGFLTEVDKNHLFTSLESLIEGTYTIEERILLHASYYRNQEIFKESLALNEVVISKGSFTRIIYIKIQINQEDLFSYSADGVIIATPTGSTAYSLSAGGPIVSPSLRSLIITPICPHTLQSRSVVVDAGESISIQFETDHGEILSAIDGQKFYHLQPEDEVQVVTAEKRIRFIRLPGYTFYRVLKSRMK